MKKLLRILTALLCTAAMALSPLAACADSPPPFAERYLRMSTQELAACMEAAMAADDLPGSTVCLSAEGLPIAALRELSAFCVARRPDGLMTLCCFVPEGNGIALAWHNDLLLSYYQEISMSTAGAVWTGGVLPDMWLQDSNLSLQLRLWNDVHLLLDCDGYYSDWTILRLGTYVIAEDGSQLPLLVVTSRDLDGHAHLSRCHPGNWLEAEDGSW